ncbi:MAG: class I SAM-dependent methyltransferase [Candidatus Sericytochromatia bacterium]
MSEENIDDLKKELEVYKNILEFHKLNSYYHPGHYYSVIPLVSEIKKRQNIIWKNKKNKEIKGLEFNITEQLSLVDDLKKYNKLIDLPDQQTNNKRFFLDNKFYFYSDAVLLFLMINNFKPKRIIEIGSGFSSALMLDLRESFNLNLELSFIEPYPDRLFSLIKENDKERTKIINKNVQDVKISTFLDLEENDILFIDSSHVSKIDSDVNFIIFEILPNLKSGVLIHFHDIYYPFEYPKIWSFNGINWNEAYLLKSFLMYNNEFKIKLFTNYLQIHYPQVFDDIKFFNKEASSLWIQKL